LSPRRAGRQTRPIPSIRLPDATSTRDVIDNVNAQSEQSFPASDPPSWPQSSISRSPTQELDIADLVAPRDDTVNRDRNT